MLMSPCRLSAVCRQANSNWCRGISRFASSVIVTRVGAGMCGCNLPEITCFNLYDMKVDLRDILDASFGECGTGMLAISAVPGFAELRAALLPYAPRLAALPDHAHRRCMDDEAPLAVGFHRQRACQEVNGSQCHTVMDSLYNKVLWDEHPTASAAQRRMRPYLYNSNKWPTSELPELAPLYKAISKTMLDVSLQLNKRLAIYIMEKKALPAPTAELLDACVRNCCLHKGRLLFYHALNPTWHGHAAGEPAQAISWRGKHTDFGPMTAITAPMYSMSNGQIECSNVQRDTAAGLYVQTRLGSDLKVAIAADSIGFMLGDAMEILSGGFLQATPHWVQAAVQPHMQGVSRSTFVLFLNCCEATPMSPVWAPESATSTYLDMMDRKLNKSMTPGVMI